MVYWPDGDSCSDNVRRFELGKAVTFTLNPPVLLKNSHPEVFEELLREEYAVLFGGLSSIHRGAEEREEILSNVSVVWGWSVLGAIVLEPLPWQQSDCDDGDDDADNDGCDDGNENVGGYVAFTLGRTIIMSAGVAREDLDEEVVRHELTHVCQFEVRNAQCFYHSGNATAHPRDASFINDEHNKHRQGWCGGELGFLSDYFAQMTVEYLRTRNADHSYRSIMQERQAYALESTNAPKKKRRTSYRPRRKHCEITQVSIPTSRSSIRRSKRLASLSAPSL